MIRSIANLLEDEHALRRISHMNEDGDLRDLFAQARIVKAKFEQLPEAGPALRALLASVQIHKDHLQATLDPSALGLSNQPNWSLRIPRPARKPFREAKLRIDAPDLDRALDHQLITLLAEASRVQRLVIASPHLSLNQLAAREGRCRKQLATLLRIGWLRPRVVEAIGSGNQPRSLTRNLLPETALPIDWSEQEALFGCVA